MSDSVCPSKFEQALASFRAISNPSTSEFACPFCGDTEIAFLMGEVIFSATMGDEELYGPAKATLATLICAKSHMFFVLENDMTAVFESPAA
jgi:hypothetical protein